MATTSVEDGTICAHVSGVGLRILIVEDNSDCADSMALLLGLYGHDVQMANTGRSALDKAAAYRPDVVLLDIGLPDMSGYDVAKQLSKHRPQKTPLLIAVTGYGRREDFQRTAAAGIDLHLVKPLDPEELCLLLKRFRQIVSK